MRFSNSSIITRFLIISALFVLNSCGLPVYETLDPPIYYSTGDNAVSFKTSNSNDVDGYVIYYKIYNYNEDEIRKDKLLFDPDYYESDTSNALPTGETLPKSLDFYPLGLVGKNTIQLPQIAWTGGGDIVQLDFTEALNQISDPSFLVNGLDMTDSFGIPARNVRYNTGALNGTFKRFVKNYRYSEDADIMDVISRQGSVSSSVEIAFTAISYGISDKNLQPLLSIPIYLGTIVIQSVDDASADPVLD